MDHPKWLELLLRIVIVESLFMFSRVTSEDQGGNPAADLLCISDCATCPVICSPAPLPLTPPEYSKPPTSSPSGHHPPRQMPYYYKPPPESNYFKSPPPPPPQMLPPRLPPPPPSYYISWGSNPPPSAPSGYVNVNPLGQPVSPMVGQRNSTYPYYYFYTAKATSLSPFLLHSKFIIPLVFLSSLIVVLDIHVGK